MSSEPPPSSSIVESVTQKLTHSMLTSASKKRKDSGDDPRAPEEEETYRSYGRHLVRTCGPFERIHVIVEHGVRAALNDDEDSEPAQPRPALTPHEKTRLQCLNKSWEILTDTIPGFRGEMISLGGNVKLRKKVCKEIQRGLDGARGDDTNKMKPSAIDWLIKIQDPAVPVASTDIPDRTKKPGRGFDSPLTAEVLCPMEYPATASTYASIKAGDKQFPINGKIPAFMYPKGHAYNDLDIEDRLLEGRLPIAAAKQIYQGPSAALQTPGFHRGRAGNAARNGQDRLGPRDVAYVCTQLYFSLSSLGSWSARDGSFSYRDFYWSIVDLFQGGEGQAILDIFNYHVFGTQTSNVNTEEAVPSTATSGFDLLAAQRAAKRARLSAATGTGTASSAS
ncbi:hypothetical protein DFH08DRAFT_1077956 [Mycena albidolilacea]|uniref:Uncharacterized protein n=1 Tax=Mycena albidolilacea TaxID=1033008 RepID=A0AAD7EVF4_9AGAR|nr:hypothetical protein DFH08DRAFT_1077956 [Mycena albidolilacea]